MLTGFHPKFEWDLPSQRTPKIQQRSSLLDTWGFFGRPATLGSDFLGPEEPPFLMGENTPVLPLTSLGGETPFAVHRSWPPSCLQVHGMSPRRWDLEGGPSHYGDPTDPTHWVDMVGNIPMIYQNLPVGVPSLNPKKNGKLAPVKNGTKKGTPNGRSRYVWCFFHILDGCLEFLSHQ